VNPKKLIVELIGTFFLVFTVGMCVIDTPAGTIPPIAIGLSLMIMVYAGGHFSGGHYNPAVTLAVFVRGKITPVEVVPYWIAQVLGAAAASGIVLYLRDHGGVALEFTNAALGKVATVEFLFTFALCYVVLNVATAKGTSGNSFYGLAIGSTVIVGAFAVGSISGGAFNPAVASGLTMMSVFSIKYVWVHILADLAGGLVAGGLFKFLYPDDL
jgi:aquaporin Z